MATLVLLGRAAALAWATPPGRSNLSTPLQQLHFPRRRSNWTLALRRVRRDAASQDNTVSTQSNSSQGEAAEQDNSASSAGAAASEGKEEEEEEAQKQKQIRDALKELKSKSSPDLWGGLVQEMGLIEWPDIGRVFGTTLVVLGIIFGSSIVLLTVNFLLADLSDLVFKVQSH